MAKNKIQQEFEKWCLEKLKSCENMQEAVDIVKLYEKAMTDNKCNNPTYKVVGGSIGGSLDGGIMLT